MERVSVAMHDRVLVVDADEWTVREALDGHRTECVASSPDGAFVLCGTYDAGLFRSTDAGETWERVPDLADESVTAVAVAPDGTAWAGTEPSAVYRSDDRGRTWTHCEGLSALPSASEWSFPPRPHTHHVRWIQPAPDDSERLYVAVEAGALVRTFDGGETWRDRTYAGPSDAHTLATHPDDPGRVYAAAGDGYFESDDRGDSWDLQEWGLDRTYCWSAAVDPADPETVLLAAAHCPRAAHDADAANSAVYRRVDGDRGSEWASAMDGLPESDGLLAPSLAAVGSGDFLAVHNHGIHRSTDSGRTWRALPVEWPGDLRDRRPAGLDVS
ncbi:WD40/YVTN/BNR-like repeat-containing protein [Halospeciosus flavus]|uniref:WD40/YVTN/BNR-like repeat-containing protein n=1 Tax=Halospeciosus flavus TaxID=3032283 RepID=A0ABD5Z8R2_9EURY|nr:hypothetical protein [Halospeciosus flavus]